MSRRRFPLQVMTEKTYKAASADLQKNFLAQQQAVQLKSDLARSQQDKALLLEQNAALTAANGTLRSQLAQTTTVGAAVLDLQRQQNLAYTNLQFALLGLTNQVRGLQTQLAAFSDAAMPQAKIRPSSSAMFTPAAAKYAESVQRICTSEAESGEVARLKEVVKQLTRQLSDMRFQE
ncbi:hypothetical protein SS50377_20847 [Spironucleus salmonicida]|uniref:Uncharacterized protein n=2 Tax=Spironucleus salmonicida TaxID=348837 RepID=A0A9P8M060_9EUKA|nr:hypothetical protein SS50377_20847 [Spironucleus salmonicida]